MSLMLFHLEKITLIASEEWIESNILPIETKKFLEEGTATEDSQIMHRKFMMATMKKILCVEYFQNFLQITS